MTLRKTLRLQRERLQHLARLRRAPRQLDADVRALLADPARPVSAVAEGLVHYFWAAHLHALDAHGTLADYPGWPSMYGARNDAIEGVARLAPLWAACVARQFGSEARLRAMRDHLANMFIHGTDPMHPGYWGDVTDRSTLICEAHDLALALWLSREQVYLRLTASEQQQVTRWFAGVLGRRTADNNWHLFVLMVDAVLCALQPGRSLQSLDRHRRVWEFERPDGCFIDGPGGHVDFYNAWGFHYPLAFLAEIAPHLQAQRAHDALAAFCTWYQWLFTENGLPLFGRSLCYRHAACAPLVLAAAAVPGAVPASTACAAFLSNWRFFTLRGGLQAGRPTQGVFGDDIRWLDVYSGPASSLWGTRSLVAWIRVFGQDDPQPQELPAHVGRIDRFVDGLGARVRAQSGMTEVQFGGDEINVATPKARTRIDRLREWGYATAFRPDNNRIKAGVKLFSTRMNQYR